MEIDDKLLIPPDWKKMGKGGKTASVAEDSRKQEEHGWWVQTGHQPWCTLEGKQGYISYS